MVTNGFKCLNCGLHKATKHPNKDKTMICWACGCEFADQEEMKEHDYEDTINIFKL